MAYILKLSFLITILIFSLQPSAAQAQSPAGDDRYIVDLTAMDYAFAMPSEIKSGWVTFRMKNIGKEEHFAAIQRVNEEVSYDSVNSWIVEGFIDGKEASLRKYFGLSRTDVSGPGFLSSGNTGETTVFLQPGIYVMICGIRTPEGDFHFNKGMVKAFAVSETKSGAPEPSFTAEIILSSLAISTDRAIGAGLHTFKVNPMYGQDVHIVQMNEGQELEDLVLWVADFKAPSPFTFLGGAEEGKPKPAAYFTAKLKPGKYALISHGGPGTTGEILNIPGSGKAPVISNQPVNPPVLIKNDTPNIEVPTGRTLIRVMNTNEYEARFEGYQLRPGFSVMDFVEWWEKVRIYQTAGFTDNPFPFMRTQRQTLAPEESTTFNLDVRDEKYLFIWLNDFNDPDLSTEERMQKVTIMTGTN